MTDAVVIGAGPAGLSAAFELSKHGSSVTVLERSAEIGGLARTIAHDGCRFDIGPHRFFTKNDEVREFFANVVADDVLEVARLTRIFYRNHLFDYPLTPMNTFKGLGIREGMDVMTSYGQTRLRQIVRSEEPRNFEEWVSSRFGSRLYEIFFKSYTEKVWGIPCSNISAEWAAQRIKGLSLGAAIRNAFFGNNNGKIKTLVHEFLFPRLGSGQTYEKLALLVQLQGGLVLTGRPASRFRHDGQRVRSVIAVHDGVDEEVEGKFFLSSAPITQLVQMMDPLPPEPVLEACRKLRYRGHIGVHLKISGNPFPDNWIYVHSRDVRTPRVSNYRNFSREMAGAGDFSPITVEYFAFEGDDMWRASDEFLVDLATSELRRTGLVASGNHVVSGFVVKSEKAYPVMELGFEEHISTLRAWLGRFSNLLPIGRSGMFKYNNQDHAIATGLLAARTVLGIDKRDPWLVNIDAEYHEEISSKA